MKDLQNRKCLKKQVCAVIASWSVPIKQANWNGIIQDRAYMRIYSGGVPVAESQQVIIMLESSIGIVRIAEQNLNHVEMIKRR